MGLFTTSLDQDIWGYAKDDGEFMPLPEREDFNVYTSPTEYYFDEEAFEKAMAEWHKTRPLNYWW